jgi:hypothetical protein
MQGGHVAAQRRAHRLGPAGGRLICGHAENSAVMRRI